MYVKYERLVEIFVKSDLRDEIRELKQGQTYDEYLRVLIENKKPPNTEASGRGSKSRRKGDL